MIMNRRRGWTAILAIAGFLLPGSVAAQAADCTYDRCALQMGRGMGATGVVRGVEQAPAGGGSFVTRVAVLEASEDSVIGAHYRASVRAERRNFWLGGATILAIIGMATTSSDDSPALGVGLPVAVVALSTLSTRNAQRGEDHLRQAIWLYNRGILADSATRPGACPYDRCALRLRADDRLVRGAAPEVVGRRGSAAAAGLFAEAGDSAAIRYEAFRHSRRSAMRGLSAGLLVTVAGLLLYTTQDDDVAQGAGIGLALAGYGIGHVSSYRLVEAENDFERAVWLYNRPLPRTP
jgi:hypothetical protein